MGEGERQGWLSTRNLRSFLQVESARQNATFIFDIQNGIGAINFPDFEYTDVSGILTTIATGAKCQVVGGSLHGTLEPID